MRKFISAAVVSAGLFLGTASAAQAPTGARSDICYTLCQYQCYGQFPGGGPAWQQCYIACARAQCGYNG